MPCHCCKDGDKGESNSSGKGGKDARKSEEGVSSSDIISVIIETKLENFNYYICMLARKIRNRTLFYLNAHRIQYNKYNRIN